jgi:exosortase J
MSTLPATEVRSTHVDLPNVNTAGLSPMQIAGIAAAFAVLGLSTIWPTVVSLWQLWTTDALKSIGMAIPLVSFVLILRAWRTLGWEMEGTWWGLALLVFTAAAVRVREQAVLVLVVSPQWSVFFPPHSLVVFAYGSGIVLLFGGVRLYRAALFPILLLWFVNPIPHIFNVFVDLPLQHASAHIARAFAMALGQPLTPDHLRLMFTPDFGMFIAPGCNGIRGAVTMGFIAMIAGYVYRFRWYANALVVLGAVAMGYLFNLLRLCTLVLYYLVALHWTWLQDKAEMGDYIIGACLFLVATLLLFYVIQRLRDSSHPVTGVAKADAPESPSAHPAMLYARLAAMGAIALLGCAGMARAGIAGQASVTAADPAAETQFPATLGNYTLRRSWKETLITGTVILVWGQYAPADGGTPIDVGISPVLGSHDTLICHSARGDDPLWQSQLTVATAGNVPVDFSSAFYNGGATQYLEASTLCNGSACGEFATERKHFGFVYSRPDAKTLLSHDAARPVPILLKAETLDTQLPADTARQQLTDSLRTFLSSVNMDELTRPYQR